VGLTAVSGTSTRTTKLAHQCPTLSRLIVTLVGAAGSGRDHTTRSGARPEAVATSSRSPTIPSPVPLTLKPSFVQRAVA
jgi:hypothetical protein